MILYFKSPLIILVAISAIIDYQIQLVFLEFDFHYLIDHYLLYIYHLIFTNFHWHELYNFYHLNSKCFLNHFKALVNLQYEFDLYLSISLFRIFICQIFHN